MHEFIAKHQDKIAGTLSGFDRLVFRGHLRSIGHPEGMMNYLWTNQILLKNFGAHVEKITERLKEASLAQAKAAARPVPSAPPKGVPCTTSPHFPGRPCKIPDPPPQKIRVQAPRSVLNYRPPKIASCARRRKADRM